MVIEFFGQAGSRHRWETIGRRDAGTEADDSAAVAAVDRCEVTGSDSTRKPEGTVGDSPAVHRTA